MTMFPALALLAAQAAVPAPQPPQHFEVAAIHLNTSGPDGGGFRALPGGRYEWTNVTLRTLVMTAWQRYNFDDRQIVGGPAWIDRDRFDVRVETGTGTPPVDPDGFPATLAAMLRALLEDRFHLVARWEPRDRPVYALTFARRDHRLGPNLAKVDTDCSIAMKALTGGQPAAPRPGRGPDCRFGGGPGILVGSAITIEMLARVLGSWSLDRPVIDRTGLSGSFDVDLRYSPEFDQPANSPDQQPPTAARAQPSIFAAVREQLGLKLEPTHATVDVLVIESAQHPTDN